MQKLLAIAAVALLAALGIAAVAWAGDSPAHPSNVAPVLSARVPPREPSPGVYSASPFSMMVVVPKSVDLRMTVAVSNRFVFKMPCLKPEMKLGQR